MALSFWRRVYLWLDQFKSRFYTRWHCWRLSYQGYIWLCDTKAAFEHMAMWYKGCIWEYGYVIQRLHLSIWLCYTKVAFEHMAKYWLSIVPWYTKVAFEPMAMWYQGCTWARGYVLEGCIWAYMAIIYKGFMWTYGYVIPRLHYWRLHLSLWVIYSKVYLPLTEEEKHALKQVPKDGNMDGEC